MDSAARTICGRPTSYPAPPRAGSRRVQAVGRSLGPGLPPRRSRTSATPYGRSPRTERGLPALPSDEVVATGRAADQLAEALFALEDVDLNPLLDDDVRTLLDAKDDVRTICHLLRDRQHSIAERARENSMPTNARRNPTTGPEDPDHVSQ